MQCNESVHANNKRQDVFDITIELSIFFLYYHEGKMR